LEFPHNFVNKENYISYEGEHPIDKNIKKWNLKKERINFEFYRLKKVLIDV
jgi:effector-binding domain-containing protein